MNTWKTAFAYLDRLTNYQSLPGEAGESVRALCDIIHDALCLDDNEVLEMFLVDAKRMLAKLRRFYKRQQEAA